MCWSALAFALLMLKGIYPPELRSTNLDADWLWRKPGKGHHPHGLQPPDELAAYLLAAVKAGK